MTKSLADIQNRPAAEQSWRATSATKSGSRHGPRSKAEITLRVDRQFDYGRPREKGQGTSGVNISSLFDESQRGPVWAKSRPEMRASLRESLLYWASPDTVARRRKGPRRAFGRGSFHLFDCYRPGRDSGHWCVLLYDGEWSICRVSHTAAWKSKWSSGPHVRDLTEEQSSSEAPK